MVAKIITTAEHPEEIRIELPTTLALRLKTRGMWDEFRIALETSAENIVSFYLATHNADKDAP